MSVEKSDLEAKLSEIQGILDETSGAARTGVIAAVGAVGIMLLVFLLGRRKGKKGKARVEVFRVG